MSGFTAIHSCIKENDAVFPVPESPVSIVILLVKLKSTTNEVWTVEK
jgi:hypothetical protein